MLLGWINTMFQDADEAGTVGVACGSAAADWWTRGHVDRLLGPPV